MNSGAPQKKLAIEC